MRRSIVMAVAAFLAVAANLAAQQAPAATARPVPQFLGRSVIYQVWMRSFTPEGTLNATRQRLRHIAELGADIVYLSPVNVHGYPSVFGPSTPYEIKDYDRIDPEYGTEDDLKALVAEAHQLGLRVIMDIVYSHSANDCVLLHVPGFFQRRADGSLIMSRWKTPQPDFSNPKVQDYFRQNMLHWVRDVGVDGFRADVAGAVPLEFWESAREALERVNPNVIMLAEADVPEHQLKAFDISYNFSYYTALQGVFVNGEPAQRIREQWEKMRAAFPRGSRFLHLNDNHDRNRVDVVFGERAAMTTSVLNFTLDGIPFMYNGQEIGDTTAPHQQAHVPIRWEMYRPTAQPRSGLLSRQLRKMEFYKGLIEMRKQQPALTSGVLQWVNNSNADAVVSFVRQEGKDEILVLINTTNRPATVAVDVQPAGYGESRDLVKKEAVRCSPSSGRLSCVLGAWDYVVAKRSSTPEAR